MHTREGNSNKTRERERERERALFHGEKNGYNATKIKVASFVYYSVDSLSFQKHCKQSAEEKADWLLLKFNDFHTTCVEHFNHCALFSFLDLYCFYSLSLSLSCITFHSLIHAYMYINNACKLISIHQ